MARDWDIDVELGHPRLTDEARVRVVRRLAQANVEQMQKRLDAEGRDLPEGVDLYRTGALQAEENISADRSGYEFVVDHAEDVEAQYHFAGLPDDVVEGLSRELEEEIGEDGVELVNTPQLEED
jgi:alkanesulfonate monooxygenase SsuD/methylene tetrahydromethanopterin reductase-like flavin-dependent oxidoreductase (luciferase family)